jgi:flavin reductase (DIM6/NTAB) family NADH-FMN oxidoreductase RutF
MTVDVNELRQCLARFPTGVAVVSCWRPDGERHGLTVNSFTSVSLEPPLIMVSVARRARGVGYLEGRSFTVNVLRAHQVPLAIHFAGRPDATLEVPWDDSPAAPRLKGALAYVECAPWQTHEGGDHLLYLGEVCDFDYLGGDALSFFCGRFGRLSVTPEPEIIALSPEEVGLNDVQFETGWFGGVAGPSISGTVPVPRRIPD